MRGCFFALVCTSAIFLAPIASAQDPYRDFRVPEARSFTWLVNGSARWNNDYSALPQTGSESRQAQGDLVSDALRHRESEAAVSDLLLHASGRWNKLRTSSQYSYAPPGGLYGSEYIYDSDAYLFLASASTTRYSHGSGWGLDAAGTGQYSYDRLGTGHASLSTSGSSESRSRTDEQLHAYVGYFAASLGLGYGRVRDATGVFDMQVLEQRLEATGRLSHPLSSAARQRLAELFAVSGDFHAAHDRPDRYLWREVERILRDDGAVEAGTFDAWSLMRALEPATLSFSITRFAGWRVSGGYEVALNRGHTDSSDQSTLAQFFQGTPTFADASTSSTSRTRDQDVEFARVDVDWHRPFGMRWQADVVAFGRYGDGHSRLMQGASTVGLTNVLADRWVATASFSQNATSQFVDGVRQSPGWNVQGTAQLSWFFEDSWSLSAGLVHSQVRPFYSDDVVSFVPLGFMRQTSVVLGLTYRPVGRFVAPGLNVAEHLAPGGI